MSVPRATLDIDLLIQFDTLARAKLVLDFLLTTDATSDAWTGRREIEWEGRKLKVVSPEGLILLKSFRGSGTDEDDIAYLRSIIDED